MKNKTRIILTSVLTLVLSLMLLIGGTFALFTDESRVDVSISSGKVDVNAFVESVELYSPTLINVNGTVSDATNAANETNFKNGGTVSVVNNELAFNQMTPGDKVSFDLVVENLSNVTVQYQTKLEMLEGFDLFTGLVITLQRGSEAAQTFDGMTAVSNWAVLTQQGEVERTTVTVELPTTAGNQYQGKTCKVAFSVKAVQGNTVVENAAANEVLLYNATDLVLFEKSLNERGNNYAGKTVKLMNDVDLAGIEWNPIGQTGATQFQGTFDGQDNTIKNMTVNNPSNSEYVVSGFFGWLENTTGVVVKNVNFENANVTGSHYVGVVAGYLSGTVKGCSVNNSTVVGINMNDDANGDKIGGIVGFINAGELSLNTVSNTTVKGNRDIGGVVGTIVLTGCTVTGNVISDSIVKYATVKTYASAGAIVSGRTGFVPDATNNASNVTIALETTVYSASELEKSLTVNEKIIKVTLGQDLVVSIANLGTSGVGGINRMGGNETQEVVIDLNGKSLKIESSYMLGLGAKNSAATVTIKNGTVKGTTTFSDTWNIADIQLADCDWVLENVTFNSPVAVNNAGKEVTMTNVNINIEGDLYALWLCAGVNVEMNGCAITTEESVGRAIKISDQYVTKADRQLTKLTVKNSTFDSAKKAAILVGSTAGAQITLENVDISAVLTDSVNAVWVDNGSQDDQGNNEGGAGNAAYSDYISLVTVAGGTVIVEP